MQRVELSTYSDPLHCPFCGEQVLRENDCVPCPHTLYIATDEGFEFVSERLDFDVDVELPDDQHIDGFTDGIDFPESLKLAIYTPAPSGFGAYVGFAALTE